MHEKLKRSNFADNTIFPSAAPSKTQNMNQNIYYQFLVKYLLELTNMVIYKYNINAVISGGTVWSE